MRQGFIKVGVSTPEVYVADCQANAEAVWKRIQEMQKSGVKIMVFPELCLTGYTCSDLFLQDRLLNEAAVQLENLREQTADTDAGGKRQAVQCGGCAEQREAAWVCPQKTHSQLQ